MKYVKCIKSRDVRFKEGDIYKVERGFVTDCCGNKRGYRITNARDIPLYVGDFENFYFESNEPKKLSDYTIEELEVEIASRKNREKLEKELNRFNITLEGSLYDVLEKISKLNRIEKEYFCILLMGGN